MDFTHFNSDGRAKMVSIEDKDDSLRIATATGKVYMNQTTLEKIRSASIKKGDVLSVSQVAGIMAAKATSTLIPMCHNINLTGVDMSFEMMDNGIAITATTKTIGKTGVEMEALTAVSVAALTIYDMCKAVDRSMVISEICLQEKVGGKSGHFLRKTRDKK